MAHTKAGGSTRQQGNRVGKRLGVKIYAGQKVISGNIIVRQRGSTFFAGSGVKTGRDYTLYATRPGEVKFIRRQGRQLITVS
ncbi:50S ribosomal protein L27 [Candidatus Amesbacteria bacterium RIFCSPHIGHO2_01_FULL_48_32]|uniref:Large ribosomal subunit protein bL27 n=1 Tax=Candidatus Amesbacteria bacterium RIFCSPLOWO2_01_FULL_48_25 TaxID=1797259 RepID=A0A1F4ZB90_9BACT|nr:MAG: 50S ribosomal protein L27 [Candidatus Amesbacteria bacterium RIFCSPHIGHO2_01_FULL_48_32]OGD03498.1 MAG: 50S ribosomal protein L27 [Candidatus Amesbacteria bacterium RIFCSPLOWO2_01_FULL_48_25]HJZ05807.1 bL27 family ribosomal protein [Patescibacteria group bacterium]